MQFRPGCILIYNQPLEYRHSDHPILDAMLRTSAAPPKYTGLLNAKSGQKLRFCVNLLVAQAKLKEAWHPTQNRHFKFRINFITLTLPAAQGALHDKTLKKACLDPWLTIMRRHFKLRSYVWRAERQFNGNLHFHITSDSWLPLEDIRSNWNHQLSKFHFINEFRRSNPSAWPNSTDVHSVQGIRNLAAYMVKYMSKSGKETLAHHNASRKKAGLPTMRPEDHHFQKIKGQPAWNTPIDGKVWDCSKNLKTKERAFLEMSATDFDWVNAIKQMCPDRVRILDNCTIINLSEQELKNSGWPKYHQTYRSWLDSVYAAAS